MPLRSADRRAFTLLEMLVAMALMSVIAGSLYAALRVGFRARDSAVAAVKPVRAAELAVELLRKDVESALPPTGILAGGFLGQDATDSAGRDADTLLLHSCAHVPAPAQRACDVRMVELALETPSNGGAPALVRRVTTNLLAVETVEPAQEVLCRGVSEFNVRYFDGSDWAESWDSSARGDALPAAVEITLELERPETTRADAEGYRISRILLLHCGGGAAEEATQIIRTTR